MGIPVPRERLETPLPHLEYLVSEQSQNSNGLTRHQTEIPLDQDTGLVDPVHLLEYLPDHPDTVPLDPTPFVHDTHSPDDWHYHHLYFDKPRYNHSGNSKHLLFRGSRYNQVATRVNNHDRYHKHHKRFVRYPPFPSIEQFLAETEILNRLSAASQGLNDTEVGTDRAEVFSEIRGECISLVDTIEVMPPSIVIGALKRIAKRTGDEVLDSVASERLSVDLVYLPIYVPRTETLQTAAATLFEKNVSLKMVF